MILAQPLARSNRAPQSWSGAAPANQQPTTGVPATGRRPPQPPSAATCQHSRLPSAAATSASAYATLTGAHRHQHQQPQPPSPPVMRHSASLSRADLERARRRQFAIPLGAPQHQPPMAPPAATAAAHSILYYPPSRQPTPASTAATAAWAQVPHGWPAPEASKPQQLESHHYAATSFARGTPVPAASESGRSYMSGRESVISRVLSGFETLKRRTGWSRNSSGRRSSRLSTTGGSPVGASPKKQHSHQLEADEIYAEGQVALEANIRKRDAFSEADIEEGELRCYLDEKSTSQPQFQLLTRLLTNWINDELAHQRIIVRDLIEDLYDGQVLTKLFEKLQGVNIDLVEVTQNSKTQRQKLDLLLRSVNRMLTLHARWAPIRWSVEGINGKSLVEILHLLITLARYYRAPIELPPNVSVEQQTAQRVNGQILRRSQTVQLTGSQNSSASSQRLATTPGRPDAFDVLFESAPEKLLFVQQSLMRFCNRHLNKIDMSCSPLSAATTTTLDPKQFSDGLLLVFLISSVENYFVPLGNLFSSCRYSAMQTRSATQYAPVISDWDPSDDQLSLVNCATAIQQTSYTNTQSIQMLHNVNLAFQLMEDAGIQVRQLARPEDIVNGDLKSLLRVLFSLFSRYKHL